jgi:hypothetical protein
MTWTFNSKAFTADGYSNNVVGYLGPAHTLTLKDDLRVGRVLPKPTTTFSGVGRTSAKLSRTLALTGSLTPTGDLIVDIQVSVPVGAASADVDAAMNDMGAALSSANFKLLAKNQQITF